MLLQNFRRNMKVFVAGATGAIGRPLIFALLRAGQEAVGMTSSEAGVQALREQGADCVVANALDAEAVGHYANQA